MVFRGLARTGGLGWVSMLGKLVSELLEAVPAADLSEAVLEDWRALVGAK